MADENAIREFDRGPDDEIPSQRWRVLLTVRYRPDVPQINAAYVTAGEDDGFVAHLCDEDWRECSCAWGETPLEACAAEVRERDCAVLEIAPPGGLFAHEQVAAETERCAGIAKAVHDEAQKQMRGRGRNTDWAHPTEVMKVAEKIRKGIVGST